MIRKLEALKKANVQLDLEIELLYRKLMSSPPSNTEESVEQRNLFMLGSQKTRNLLLIQTILADETAAVAAEYKKQYPYAYAYSLDKVHDKLNKKYDI
jgi:hypothetical protein